MVIFKRLAAALIICASFSLLLFGCSQPDSGDNTDDQTNPLLSIGEEGPEIEVAPIDTALSITGFDPVAENDNFLLFINKKTTEIAVIDKPSGHIWYSNPPGADADPIANNHNRNNLKTQVEISYFNKQDVQNTVSNVSSTVEYGRYRIKNIQNGVQVSYVIGDFKKPLLTPSCISEERFEYFYDKIADDDEKRQLKKRYRKVDISLLSDRNEKDMMLATYPSLANGPVYIRYPVYDYILEELAEILQSVGYTADDLEIDESLNVQQSTVTKARFAVTLNYTLDKDGFVVHMPISELHYPKNYPIYTVSLLNFFGAAGVDKSGYIFVPDGSGALINLNNGKTNELPYENSVYGSDLSTQITSRLRNTIPCSIPVFGLKEDDNAFLAIIEEGDSAARINADISGRVNSYNNVFAKFVVKNNTQVNMHYLTGKATLNAYQPGVIDEDVKIRYVFLNGDNADYSGMAQYYRQYLLDNSKLKKTALKPGLPYIVDVYGALDITKTKFGMPVKDLLALTTYEECKNMLSDIVSSGVANLSLRYYGWFNGGYNHTLPTAVKPIDMLGGEKELKNLIDYTRRNSIDLFFDANLLYLSNKKAFDGFNVKKNGIRFMDKSYGLVYDTNIATLFNEINPKYIISPNSLMQYFTDFLNSAKNKINGTGLSLRDMGYHINSDFNEKKPADRAKTLGIYSSIASKAASNGYKLLSDGPNGYAYSYSDAVMGVPNSSNLYRLQDESIPFLQMILSGSLSYFATPINLSGDYEYEVLKAAETGAGLYAILVNDYNTDIKKSDYNFLYSVSNKQWQSRLLSTYKEMNAKLSKVFGKKIIKHLSLAENVNMTVYENGAAVVVNYNDIDFNAADLDAQVLASYPYLSGITVLAESYSVIGG